MAEIAPNWANKDTPARREAAAAALARAAALREALLDKLIAGQQPTPAERAEWAQLRALARRPA